MVAIGMQLGPYKVLAPLGAGGMGEVYRARDSRLDRDVAIKVLPEPFARDADRLARFEREAKAVAALSHPNILAIYDCGRERGISFAVTELLDGETLRQRVTHSALPWRKAVEVGVAIADGLAAAHAKGIIHRDLKPENVFLTADGRVKILDFGLARVDPAAPPGTVTGSYHPTPTEPGTVMGTVGYMAPEQVRGQPVDARTDLFALGCVLYEMVTGQRAFARPTGAETMTAILHDEPPEVVESGNKVPSEVERVIRHCLEKSPAARFHSAHDLAFALRALSDSGVSKPSSRPIPIRPVVWATVLLGLVAVSGTAVFLRTRDNPPAGNAPRTGPAASSDSLAVLPFVNASKDPEAEHLGDEIPGSIIKNLSAVRNLKVRPLSSASRFYRGPDTDLQEVGRQLDVHIAVTGKVVRRNDGLSVSVELVDLRDNRVLWREQYDRTDLLALPEVVSKQVCDKLQVPLTVEERKHLTKRYTENAEAFDLYLKGRHHQLKRTKDGLVKSIAHFEKAIAKDPSYALAFAGLADSYSYLGNHGFQEPQAAAKQARAYAEKAIALDDTLAEAHTALAYVQMVAEWDWRGAGTSYRRALQLNPRYATAYSLYAWYLSAQGRFDEGLAAIRQAVSLDRLSLYCNANLGWHLYVAGRPDEALNQLRLTLELDPNDNRLQLDIGLVLEQKEMYEEAIAAFQKAITLGGRFVADRAALGHAYALAGKRSEAARVLNELRELANQGEYVSSYELAIVHVGLGGKEEAFLELEKAHRQRDGQLPNLKVDPRFGPLHPDPRFADLLRRIGLADSTAAKEQPLDTLAVLPFDNQSTDAEAGYLGDDITYSLTEALMRVRDLKVRPYTSAARHRGKDIDARTAGKALDVQAVVKGVVNKRGEQLVVIVDVVDVREADRPIVTARYEGPAQDRLRLQQQILTELPEKLRLTLTGQQKQELARQPTQNLKAHELYVRGRLAWNRRTVADLKRAIDCFDQAIQLDPDYAQAYAGKADGYAVLPYYEGADPKGASAKAREAALQALQRDSTLGEAHAALAHVKQNFDWDFPGAEREYRRSLDLKPNYPTGRHWYGDFLVYTGRLDAGIAELEQAKQLDPESLVIRCALAQKYAFAQRYTEAAAECHAALAKDRTYAVAHINLGLVLAYQHKYGEAIPALETALQFDPHTPRTEALLGYAYGTAGKTAEARHILQRLRNLRQQSDVSPVYFAYIHLALGEKDQALAELERGFRERSPGMVLLNDPLFDSLRNEPRFQKILADMKLPP